jgi:hypothetical protein
MTPHPIRNVLPRWTKDYVSCLVDALRQAGMMADLCRLDRQTNPLAVFAVDSFEHFVLDVGREEAIRLLDEVGFDCPDGVDAVLEQYA